MIEGVCQTITRLEPARLTLLAVVLAGLADGINPCAIGMMIFLLGYLVVFAGRPDRILKVGLTYITAVYITYFLIGAVFYQTLNKLFTLPRFPLLSVWLLRFLGLGLAAAGAVNIKDFFFPGKGFSLEIPQRIRPRLQSLVERVSLPATAVLAAAVTIFETPCSFPLYAGTVGILSRCGLSNAKLLAMMALYNFFFVLPLFIILALVYGGREFSYLKEWEHRNKRWMRLTMGVLLVILGVWMGIGT